MEEFLNDPNTKWILQYHKLLNPGEFNDDASIFDFFHKKMKEREKCHVYFTYISEFSFEVIILHFMHARIFGGHFFWH